MSITTSETREAITRAVRRGLRALERPEPLRLSQWADEHFYLVAESSYIEGRWETLPHQRAPMDCISNDDIRIVTLRKSARVGYTKIIVAAVGYFAEHKKRNQLIYQPVDQDAEDFVKDEIDPMLRDVVAVQRVFPYFGMKSKNNTLQKKVFVGSTLDVRGARAAKNFRRLSKDVVYYDELDGCEPDVENEGDPLTLGDRRVEGSTFPKSVRGSTPGIAGASMIAKAEESADLRFAWHFECPHCQHLQRMVWGGPQCKLGFKWVDGDPHAAAYCCESCASLITFEEYVAGPYQTGRYVAPCGTWIDNDGHFHAASGEIIPPPEHVAFHMWSGMAGQTPWWRIVDEFLKATKAHKEKRDNTKLKGFVTLTLGEPWEEETGERTDSHALQMRREHYRAEVPEGGLILVAGIDTQDDRFEIQIDAYGIGEERWSVDYIRLFGDPSRPLIWDKLAEQLRRGFTRADGTVLHLTIACQDHGGHYSDEVNAFSRRMGVRFLIPVKGSNEAGQPVALMPRELNTKGVYLTRVGTDTAKSLLNQRYKITTPGAGYVHWPVSEAFDSTYFEQVTAEEMLTTWRNGARVTKWDAKGRRNEATDCSVYSLAAVRIAQQNLGIQLVSQSLAMARTAAPRKLRRSQTKYGRG